MGFATGSWLLGSCCALVGVVPTGFNLDFEGNFNGILSNFAHQLASGEIARLTEDSPAGQLQRVAAVALSDALKDITSGAPEDCKSG